MLQEPATDDAPVRKLLADRVRAIQAKDFDALAAQYDAGVVMYNLAPPLQIRGVDREGLARGSTATTARSGARRRTNGSSSAATWPSATTSTGSAAGRRAAPR
jgi:ketosteroid isomerase-like protein